MISRASGRCPCSTPISWAWAMAARTGNRTAEGRLRLSWRGWTGSCAAMPARHVSSSARTAASARTRPGPCRRNASIDGSRRGVPRPSLPGVVLGEGRIAVVGVHVVALHAVPGDEADALVEQHLRILELLRGQQFLAIGRQLETLDDMHLVAVRQ